MAYRSGKYIFTEYFSCLYVRSAVKPINNIDYARSNLNLVTATYSTNVASVPNQHNPPKQIEYAKSYWKKVKEKEKFRQEQLEQYNKTKLFLAKIMKEDPETFTHDKVQDTIRYLFPSALYNTLTRPHLFDPFQAPTSNTVPIFDKNGRPIECFFYTSCPQYTNLMHQCGEIIEEMDKKIRNVPPSRYPKDKLSESLISDLLTKQQIERKIRERLLDSEYEKFVDSMTVIINHPRSNDFAEFVSEYLQESFKKKNEVSYFEREVVELSDGRKSFTVKKCKRKKSTADVTVIVPGTGKIEINKTNNILFFKDVFSREQVSTTYQLIIRPLPSKQFPVDLNVKSQLKF